MADCRKTVRRRPTPGLGRRPSDSIDYNLCARAFMTNLKGLSSIVAELRLERTNLVNQLQHVDAALAVLGKLDGGSNYTEPRRRMSASAGRRISLVQKARWAKRSGKTTGSAPAKRTMSAVARRKIAAAQRKRWAKVKAQQKKTA